MPNHYLNQCWNIVNWTLGNKLRWNLNQNLNIMIQENAFENIIWKMAAILSWPQCVNHKSCDQEHIFLCSNTDIFIQATVFQNVICKCYLFCPRAKEWTLLVLKLGYSRITWTTTGTTSVFSNAYCQTSTISCTLVCNKIVDHSDVVGASPAPTTSSFST